MSLELNKARIDRPIYSIYSAHNSSALPVPNCIENQAGYSPAQNNKVPAAYYFTGVHGGLRVATFPKTELKGKVANPKT